MDWFRFHDESLNDPKLRRYFTKAERWDWAGLLCLANKSKRRGIITLPDDEIAYALDLSDEEWLSLCARFEDRRMIRREEDGALIIVNWAQRQYDKPSDTPEQVRERVHSYRQRVKQANEETPEGETSQNGNTPETQSNAPVTPLKRDETPRVRTLRGEQQQSISRAYTEPEPQQQPRAREAEPAAVSVPEEAAAAAADSPNGLALSELPDDALLEQAKRDYPPGDPQNADFWKRVDARWEKAKKNPHGYVRPCILEHYAKAPPGHHPPGPPGRNGSKPPPSEQSQDREKAAKNRVVSYGLRIGQDLLRSANVPESEWKTLGKQVRDSMGEAGERADFPDVVTGIVALWRQLHPTQETPRNVATRDCPPDVEPATENSADGVPENVLSELADVRRKIAASLGTEEPTPATQQPEQAAGEVLVTKQEETSGTA